MIKRDKYDVDFKQVRPAVIQRDGGCCIKCGSTLSIEVHHIEGYEDNRLESLVTLCFFCHGIAPMGVEVFKKWVVAGKSGLEVLKEKLSERGLERLSVEQIHLFCTVLYEVKWNDHFKKLRVARERMREKTGKCSGRKAYGEKADEVLILGKMLEQRSSGKTCKQIADVLNTEGMPTRMGGKWREATVAKIIARSKPKNTEQHNDMPTIPNTPFPVPFRITCTPERIEYLRKMEYTVNNFNTTRLTA